VGKTDGGVCSSFVTRKASQEPPQLLLIGTDAGDNHFRYKMNTSVKDMESSTTTELNPLEHTAHVNAVIHKEI
jgi:hypothetical protein